jgi:hypothetical protein
MRVVSTYTTKPRLGGSGAGTGVAADATGAVDPARDAADGAAGVALTGARASGVFVWYGTPWRGLILPPPGGGPYFATISGGAMMAP